MPWEDSGILGENWRYPRSQGWETPPSGVSDSESPRPVPRSHCHRGPCQTSKWRSWIGPHQSKISSKNPNQNQVPLLHTRESKRDLLGLLPLSKERGRLQAWEWPFMSESRRQVKGQAPRHSVFQITASATGSPGSPAPLKPQPWLPTRPTWSGGHFRPSYVCSSLFVNTQMNNSVLGSHFPSSSFLRRPP